MTRNATSWKPGQSGNPAGGRPGRPPGSGPHAAIRQAVAEHLPAVVSRLAELGLAGDAAALRALLEFGLPKPRPESLPAPLPLPADAPLSEQGQTIIAELAAGHVGIHEAAALLAAIGSHAKALQVTELVERMERIERAIAERAGHA